MNERHTLVRSKDSIDTHNTDPELYAALAAAFGETSPRDGSTTRWVTVGAGRHSLTFFKRDVTA